MKPSIDLYSAFLASIPDAVLVVDKDGRVVGSNEVAAELFASSEILDGQRIDVFLPQDLVGRHRTHLANYWRSPQRRAMGEGGQLRARRRNGREFPIDIMLSPLSLAEGEFVVCVIRDRSEHLAREEALQMALENETRLARCDHSTGIANVRSLRERIEQELSRALRNEQPFTLACIDLDHFKRINDEQGHSEGDRVLKVVAECLVSSLRECDLVARVGGDEFAVLMPECDATAARAAISRTRDRLLDAMQGHHWSVTFSIGVVSFVRPPETVDNALREADQLMYGVKRNGRDGCAFAVWDPG